MPAPGYTMTIILQSTMTGTNVVIGIVITTIDLVYMHQILTLKP